MKNNLRFAQFAFTMFLTTALIFCGMPLTKVQAAPAPNTDWYNSNDREFTIRTAEELAGLASLVNGYSNVTFQGKIIKLGNDIDLATYDWTAIGSEYRYFKGTFDGCGYAIKNLTINNGSGTDALFGGISEAIVKNFSLTNVNISVTNLADDYGIVAGAVAVAEESLVSDIYMTGNVITSSFGAGGIVGGAIENSKIMNCSMNGKVSSIGISGGIAAVAGENSIIEKCSVSGEVNVSSSYSIDDMGVSGGIVGLTNTTEIINCYSTANVNANTPVVNIAGGIVGDAEYTKIINCYSSGEIKSLGDSSIAGGICASLSDSEIKNCYSTANVTSLDSSGGIAGFISYESTINSCYATGTISAAGSGTTDEAVSAGGIAGGIEGGEGIKITNCVALNDKVSTKDSISESVGRVVGYIYPSDSSVCSNNFGINTTALSYGSGSKSIASNKNGNDGETVTSSNLNSAWVNFDSSVWNIESGKLPTLKNVGATQGTQNPAPTTTTTTTTTNTTPAGDSSENDIISFKIGNASGVISRDGVLIEVPHGTDLKNISPVIEISKGAKVSPNSGVSQDFSKSVTYVVTAENGTTKGYLVTVTVLAPTTTATPQTTSAPITTTPPTTSGIDVIINGERENPVAPTLVNSSDDISDSGNTNNSGNTAGAEKENPSTMDSVKDNVIKFSILVIAAGAVVLFTSGTRDDKKKKILNK